MASFAAGWLLPLFSGFTALDGAAALALWAHCVVAGFAPALRVALALLLSLRPVLAGAPLETCLAALATPRLHLARALGIGAHGRGSQAESEGEGEGTDEAEKAQEAEAAAATEETAIAMRRLWRRAFGDGTGDGDEAEEDAAIAALCVVGEAELAELEGDFAFASSTAATAVRH